MVQRLPYFFFLPAFQQLMKTPCYRMTSHIYSVPASASSNSVNFSATPG